MRKLIIILIGSTIGITLAMGLITGSQLTTVVTGGICILITVITAFLTKRSFKSTKGMEDL